MATPKKPEEQNSPRARGEDKQSIASQTMTFGTFPNRIMSRAEEDRALAILLQQKKRISDEQRALIESIRQEAAEKKYREEKGTEIHRAVPHP